MQQVIKIIIAPWWIVCRWCGRMCGSAHQPKSVHSVARSALLGHLGAESGRTFDGAGRCDRSFGYVCWRLLVVFDTLTHDRRPVIQSYFRYDCIMRFSRDRTWCAPPSVIDLNVFISLLVFVTGNAFPDLVPPSNKVVYDTLGKLIRDRKVETCFAFYYFLILYLRFPILSCCLSCCHCWFRPLFFFQR